MSLIQLPSGDNLSKITSGAFGLECGGTYFGTIAPQSGCTVVAYGDPAKGKPVVKGRVGATGKSDITIQGIRFDGTGRTTGCRFYNVKRLRFLDNEVYNYGGDGLNVQGANGGTCDDVLIEGNLIYRNHPTGKAHCQGMFVNYTTNLKVLHNIFDTNGWDGTTGATIFNHNVYLHGTNGPAHVEGNIFANSSSYGIQQRCGGLLLNNVFLNNEATSYGWVKGEAVFTGGVGVRGKIFGNWWYGNRTDRVGWSLDLGNLGDVDFSDCYFCGNKFSDSNAVSIKKCEQVENPDHYLDPSKWNARIERIYKWNGWPNGAVLKIAGGPGVVIESSCVKGIVPPNANADLDKALGGWRNFLTQYWTRPREAAAEAIRRFKTEAGFTAAPSPAPQPAPAPNPTPTPEPAPQPEPSPAPTPSATLESLVRKDPSKLVAVIEGGQARLKYIQSGTDPRWTITGDTISGL